MRKLLKSCEFEPVTITVAYSEVEDMANSNPVWSDDAEWLSQTELEKFFWHYPVVMDNNWNVLAKLCKNDYSKDIYWNVAPEWNVMVAFPRRWIKVSKDWNRVTVSFTKENNKQWYQYYAHTTWTWSSKINKDVFYLWVYNWNINETYGSVAWVNPDVSRNFDTCYNYAKSLDWNDWVEWYTLETFYMREYLIWMFIMVYWRPDSQSVIWNWINTGSRQEVWSTYNKWMTYWDLTSWTEHVKLFWIEDLWWNVLEFVWWIYVAENTYNIYTKLSKFTNRWVDIKDIWFSDQFPTTRQNRNITSVCWTNDAMFIWLTQVNNDTYNTYYKTRQQIRTHSYCQMWWGSWSWISCWIIRHYLWWQISQTSLWNPWTAWFRIAYI